MLNMGFLNNPQNQAITQAYDDSMLGMPLLDNPTQQSLALAKQYDDSMMLNALLDNPVQQSLNLAKQYDDLAK